MNIKLNIIIVDDHSIMTDGYETVITDNTYHKVLAKANSGKQLLQLLNSHKPQLIVLDLNMPDIDGLEAATIIKRKYPEIKILVMSMYEDTGIKNTLLSIGVEGYVSKTTNAREFLDVLENIANGNTVYKLAQITEPVNVLKKSDSFRLKYKLSEREMEIITMVKEGKTSKEISRLLYLSEYTVETHRKNIFKKIKIKSMGELIKWAVDNHI